MRRVQHGDGIGGGGRGGGGGGGGGGGDGGGGEGDGGGGGGGGVWCVVSGACDVCEWRLPSRLVVGCVLCSSLSRE